MKQAHFGLNLSTKRTRKREFMEEMERMVRGMKLASLVPHYPKAEAGRPPFGVHTMLRIQFSQQWFGLSDPAVDEALHHVPLYRRFIGLDNAMARLPDETTILQSPHLLERQVLADQMLLTVNALRTDKRLVPKKSPVVDSTLTAAPSSTEDASGERNPAIHQAAKGNPWHFGLKAHLSVNAESDRVHRVPTTPGNADHVTAPDQLAKTDVFADAVYQVTGKRYPGVTAKWHIAMRPGIRGMLDLRISLARLIDDYEQITASIRGKVERPFWMIKRQFGFTNVRYRRLANNPGQILKLFALSNLWMAREQSMRGRG